jgi:hypothetical protein
MMTIADRFLTNFNSIPEEVLCVIFGSLTPKEKAIAAQVCRLWKRLAEDSSLLLQDFKSEHSLSPYQLSCLIGIGGISAELSNKICLKFREKMGFRPKRNFYISHHHLNLILEKFQTNPIPDEIFFDDNFKWINHLRCLGTLEHCFRMSPDFSLDAAHTIFIQHLEYMKTQGFNVNNNLTNTHENPAEYCVNFRLPALLKALHYVGADLNQSSSHFRVGKKPIHSIVNCWYEGANQQSLTEECIQVLFVSEANLDATHLSPYYHITALWQAAKLGYSETVKTLAQFGCDVNYQIKNNLYEKNYWEAYITPLLIATCSGHTETVRVLIQYGADPNIKSYYNQTALEIAVERVYLEIIEILNKAE